MPRANPDYAEITKAAHAISRADPKAADTLSGRTDHRRDALFAAALVYQGNGTEASADWLNGQVTALADGFTEYLAPTPDFKECIEIPCSDDQAAELEAERVSSAVTEVGCRLLKKGYGPGRVSDIMDVVRSVIEERFVR